MFEHAVAAHELYLYSRMMMMTAIRIILCYRCCNTSHHGSCTSWNNIHQEQELVFLLNQQPGSQPERSWVGNDTVVAVAVAVIVVAVAVAVAVVIVEK